MILYAFIALSTILLFNKNLALRGVLIFSLAIPTSFETTSFFSINVAGFNFLYTDLLVGIAIIAWILTPNKIPLGRFAQLSDVATAVAYLASDSSSMITGTSILVDGGWTAI